MAKIHITDNQLIKIALAKDPALLVVDGEIIGYIEQPSIDYKEWQMRDFKVLQPMYAITKRNKGGIEPSLRKAATVIKPGY